MSADLQNNHHKPETLPDRVTVYAAASTDIPEYFHQAVKQLGNLLAQAGIVISYGGGGTGLMGTLANAALESGGQVFGIIPEFLLQREVGHRQLTDLQVVDDMRVRKERMLLNSAAVIAVPGGVGTLEELFEAITLKRVGLYHGEIIILNTAGYYSKLLEFLNDAGQQGFIATNAGFLVDCWRVAETPEQVIELLPDY